MKKKNPYEMANFSYSNIDGLYSNNFDGDNLVNLDLWKILKRSCKKKTDPIETYDGMFVKLTMINDETINVKLIDIDKSVKDEFLLNGKIDNNYFSVDRKYFLLPIPFIFLHFETKNLIGNSMDRNLVIMHGTKSEGWILIMAAGAGGITDNKFMKVN